jgi:hypothetical protein
LKITTNKRGKRHKSRQSVQKYQARTVPHLNLKLLIATETEACEFPGYWSEAVRALLRCGNVKNVDADRGCLIVHSAVCAPTGRAQRWNGWP